MGLRDLFRRPEVVSFEAKAAPRLTEPDRGWHPGPSVESILGLSAEEMWRTQPYLRTVVTFMARNIAQLGLQTFVRVDETDRQRDRSGPLAITLARPNGTDTSYDLIFGLVADIGLYDTAYLYVTQDAAAPGGWTIHRLLPTWVTPKGGDAFSPARYEVRAESRSEPTILQAKDVIDFHGWNPTDARFGSSPVSALREILAEQVQAMRYRSAVWQRGGKVSSVITRPAGAPWSDAARESFRADWNSKYTGNGKSVGGTPILEDGMTINKVDFNATEQQFIEGARLALNTVASVYHINPTMIGLLDNANYSNVREFRKMLYGDSLGPVIAMIEDRLNTFLVPMIDKRPGVYVEFNIAEKLQGNFEEQTTALQSAVGRPWMTADEARGKFNMPSLGGDAAQIVTPLNVLVGGQASPQDSAPKGGPVRVKARAPQTYEAKHAEVLVKFFRRQSAAVKSSLGAKAADEFWDAERWNGELSDDLYVLALQVTREVSAKTLEGIGYGPDAYDADRTLAWLREVSDRSAKSINDTTKAQIDAALEADDPDAAVTSVFDVAEGQRSGAIAATAVTLLSGFATTEAAKQVAGDKATKTWIAGPKPRASHAAMSGETVPLSENFSNGMAWPGDSAGGADEVAGCNCSLQIDIP